MHFLKTRERENTCKRPLLREKRREGRSASQTYRRNLKIELWSRRKTGGENGPGAKGRSAYRYPRLTVIDWGLETPPRRSLRTRKLKNSTGLNAPFPRQIQAEPRPTGSEGVRRKPKKSNAKETSTSPYKGEAKIPTNLSLGMSSQRTKSRGSANKEDESSGDGHSERTKDVKRRKPQAD